MDQLIVQELMLLRAIVAALASFNLFMLFAGDLCVCSLNIRAVFVGSLVT
jgi:hypothetical protein